MNLCVAHDDDAIIRLIQLFLMIGVVFVHVSRLRGFFESGAFLDPDMLALVCK